MGCINGFYVNKEEFWYQPDLSTMIFKDFMPCSISLYTCRISSLHYVQVPLAPSLRFARNNTLLFTIRI